MDISAIFAVDGLDGLVDAALQGDGRRAGGDGLEALAVDGLGEDGRGRRAVAGDVVRLLRGLGDELGPHVLEGVLELDLLGHGDAVTGDDRAAEGLLGDDVATGGPRVTRTASARRFTPCAMRWRASTS